MRFKDKVAVITAAAGAGIGHAIAQLLGEEGASLVICDVHQRRTQETVADFETRGIKAIGVLCDVSQADQVEAMKEQAMQTFGRIDYLVNNAGREVIAPIAQYKEEDWDMVLDVCLKGAFLCTRAVLPIMMEQLGGAIVNISSAACYVGSPGEAAYCAAKAGVNALTRVTAAEGAPHVRANAIAPGYVPNPFLNRIYPREVLDHMAGMSVLKRGAEPREMAEIAAFLLSDAASFVTGTVTNGTAGMMWTG
jgi:3-oxoacyl-[acyl-carrier protein] reductase